MIQCKCYKEDTYIQKADVDNWIEIWIERKSPLVKESTFAAYSNILVNHLLPTFGELELTEITEERMQEYVFSLVKEGRLDGKGGLNPSSAKDMLIVLKTTLRDAMRAKELPRMVYDVRVPIKRWSGWGSDPNGGAGVVE